jgi:nucleotide-binding universal stress UspA family protein
MPGLSFVLFVNSNHKAIAMNAIKILVPTDFSDSANNAAEYAMSLAADLDAAILLFQAFHVPVPTTEMPILVISPGELAKDNLLRLDNLRKHLIKKYGRNVPVECLATPGFAAEEILDAARSSRANLIVIGISGSGSLVHTLMGSVPTDILPDLNIPMLVIPEEASYKKPEKLIFACDYSVRIGQKALVQLRDFVKSIHAHIYVVDVKEPGKEIAPDKVNEIALIKDALKDVIHSVHVAVNKDVIDGLLRFQEKHPADVMVMIPRRHSFLERVFNTPHTTEMVFKSKIPVLALQE